MLLASLNCIIGSDLFLVHNLSLLFKCLEMVWTIIIMTFTSWILEDAKINVFENEEFVAYADGKYHSATGPLKISSTPIAALDNKVAELLKESGVQFIPDLNIDNELGHTFAQLFVSNGRRSSSATAYLNPVKNRPNLHVIKHAYVNRILLDDKNEAYGVEFEYKERYPMKAYSKKEVIVSAGAIQSPTLLMRSGIGPKEHLEKHKINCKADLAVGENYIDHVYVPLIYTLPINGPPLPYQFIVRTLFEYAVSRSGPLGSPTFTLSAHINTVNGTGAPDIQLYYGNFPRGVAESVISDFLKYASFEHLYDTILDLSKNYDFSIILVTLIKPKSRGSIKLNECKKCSESKINANYLTDPEDRATLMRGMKYVQSICASEPFEKIGTSFARIPMPECDKLEYLSDSYWDCYMSYFSIAGSHQVGTSKMGTDPEAVVDQRMNVHKTKRLRQIDAGIIPVAISGNTNSAAAMVGERGADFIKADHMER